MTKSPSTEWLPEWALESLLPLMGEASIWLVGGAIRDKFLNVETVDYDFAVADNARKIARGFADSLGAFYFDLDSERDTGRVIYIDDHKRRFLFDFARLRGASIQEDLRTRDFTINCLAVDLNNPHEIIDPTQGLSDIKDGIIRAASTRSFLEDPIRVLRIVRFALQIEGRIESDTLALLRGSIDKLSSTSVERIRDEVFRIFALPHPIGAIRLMDHLDLVNQVFPELEAMKDVRQSPPHDFDVWRHTLSVVEGLGRLITVMAREHDPEGASQLSLGEFSLRLGRYREGLNDYLDIELSQGRSMRQLIYLAALYHDSGKPSAMEIEDDRIKFIGHEQEGAQILKAKAKDLRLSNHEVQWACKVVEGHLRPAMLAESGKATKRSVYRFLRDTMDAAPGILLLSLADALGRGNPPVDQEFWGERIQVVRDLLGGYFDSQNVTLIQRPLLKGDEISLELDVAPGPVIGEILEALREAQAIGEIQTRSEALSLARSIKERQKDLPDI
jgi:tRNA nucleotidyltransferase/poly(A) polymerase